jgi:hypothetical protein
MLAALISLHFLFSFYKSRDMEGFFKAYEESFYN